MIESAVSHFYSDVCFVRSKRTFAHSAHILWMDFEFRLDLLTVTQWYNFCYSYTQTRHTLYTRRISAVTFYLSVDMNIFLFVDFLCDCHMRNNQTVCSLCGEMTVCIMQPYGSGIFLLFYLYKWQQKINLMYDCLLNRQILNKLFVGISIELLNSTA